MVYESSTNLFLNSYSELLDDDDEVLLQLAESLSSLTDYLGGSQYAHLLLNPLEKLCYIEDIAVRDKVIIAFGD